MKTRPMKYPRGYPKKQGRDGGKQEQEHERSGEVEQLRREGNRSEESEAKQNPSNIAASQMY